MNSFLLKATKTTALVIFIALVPLLFLYEEATSLVWTMILPLLPIFIILIGFSKWRDICPLAFFSKVSQNLNWIQKRKVPQWFEENFYYFGYFFLFSAFTLRLTTLNFNNLYLGLFFILIIFFAFFTNIIFTGKSWCNFFCPVGVVEKIYCVSNAKKYMYNSACSTCTACKNNCPDIDMESNYWKESVLEQKSFVFYSFPGLVLGFYLYFYLQSGTMSYYFSGDWTSNNFSIFSSGFFFAPFIPVYLAVPLTLFLFSFSSFFMFDVLEKYFWKKRVFKNANYETTLHKLKVITSFIAFNIFYIFAGAPTYSHYPILYALFYFIIVAFSATHLYKEIFREQSYFIQERFALKILKKWNSEKPIPSNLKEIYYTYINDNKNKKHRLRTYKDTIEDLMQEGILNEGSVIILEKLREQIGISKKEHLNAIRSLKLKHVDLFDNSIEKSTERIYQRNSYTKLIEEFLTEHFELDSTYLKSLQKQFCISDDEHKKIMDSILNNNKKFHIEILNLLNELHELLKIRNTLLNDNSSEVSYLRCVIKSEFLAILSDLFSLLFLIYKDNHQTLNILLDMAKEKQVDSSFIFNEDTLSFMDDEITDKMILLKSDFDVKESQVDLVISEALISELLTHKSINIATAALLILHSKEKQTLLQRNLDRFKASIDKDILSLIDNIIKDNSEITTYERMMYLNGVSMFKNITLQDLKLLARSTQVVYFEKESYIVREGEVGNDLFIIIHGKAGVEIGNSQIVTMDEEDYFGEIAILGDTKRTASVKALENITAITISKQEFKRFIYENPTVSTKVIKEVIQKLLDSQS